MPAYVIQLAGRLIWGVSWLFGVVCGLAILGSIALTAYSLYHRDVQLAQSSALLLGAAALGLLLAIAGVYVASTP